MIGPAVATLIATFVYAFLILRKTIKEIDAKWGEIFDVKDVVRFVFILAVIWGAAVGIDMLLNYLGVHKYASMIIAMAFFGFSQLFINKKQIFGVIKKINGFKLS